MATIPGKTWKWHFLPGKPGKWHFLQGNQRLKTGKPGKGLSGNENLKPGKQHFLPGN